METEQVEESYSTLEISDWINGGLTWSQCYKLLTDQKCMAQEGWPEGKYIYLVPGSQFKVSRAPLLDLLPEGTIVTYRPHIDIRHSDGTTGVYGLTQDDIFACNWKIATIPKYAKSANGSSVNYDIPKKG